MLQFPIAVWQFSIASDDSGSDFTSLRAMETVACGGRFCRGTAFFRVGNRADVVESTRQFHLYRLCCPKSGGNRGTMARISEGREQVLFIPTRSHAFRIAISRANAGRLYRAGLVETRRGGNWIDYSHWIFCFSLFVLGFDCHFCQYRHPFHGAGDVPEAMSSSRGVSRCNASDMASPGLFLFALLVWDGFDSGCANDRRDCDMCDLLPGCASLRWDSYIAAIIRMLALVPARVSSPVWSELRCLGEFHAAGISAHLVRRAACTATNSIPAESAGRTA